MKTKTKKITRTENGVKIPKYVPFVTMYLKPTNGKITNEDIIFTGFKPDITEQYLCSESGKRIDLLKNISKFNGKLSSNYTAFFLTQNQKNKVFIAEKNNKYYYVNSPISEIRSNNGKEVLIISKKQNGMKAPATKATAIRKKSISARTICRKVIDQPGINKRTGKLLKGWHYVNCKPVKVTKVKPVVKKKVAYKKPAPGIKIVKPNTLKKLNGYFFNPDSPQPFETKEEAQKEINAQKRYDKKHYGRANDYEIKRVPLLFRTKNKQFYVEEIEKGLFDE